MYEIKELMDVLLNVRKLPTLSPIAIMLIESLSEKEPDVPKISKIISDDPAITSMILKVANSAMYGARRTIYTVQDAVVRLGLKEVNKIVIDISMVNYMSEMPEGLLDLLDFWKHSIGVAFCIEELQLTFNVLENNGPQSHVIGLLHDIGRLITATHMPEVHQNFSENSTECTSSATITFWEKEIIGLDHSQIGAAVLERWGLPIDIVNAIRYHHYPEVAPKPNRKTCQLIYLADCICRQACIGGVGEGPVIDIENKAWSDLGLSDESKIELVEKVQDKTKKSEVILSMSNIS